MNVNERNRRDVNRGRLLAFEGLDGSGKTTQVARLCAALERAGISALATREPTDGAVGRRIREMAASGETLAPETELQWFFEDRREHVAEVIEPALKAGHWVVTDRYFLSTVAYQGARGLDAQQILADSEREFPLPDLVVLLEVDATQGLERVVNRGGVLETVFEQADFQRRVAGVFDSLELAYLARVSGRGRPDEVERAVAECVSQRLGVNLAVAAPGHR